MRRTVSGRLRPVTGKFTTPVRDPAAPGVKRIVMLQLDFGATSTPEHRSLVMAKSAPLTPEIITVPSGALALPTLFKVTDAAALVVPSAWVPKSTIDGLIVTARRDPVPVSATVCGLERPLSVMLSSPFRGPVVLGAKLTPIVQVLPTATVVPEQPSAATAKLALAATLIWPSGSGPTLVRVTICGGLEVVTPCSPKPSAVGLTRPSVRLNPVPVMVAVCGDPGASSATLIVALVGPSTWGSKTMSIPQESPAPTVMPEQRSTAI